MTPMLSSAFRRRQCRSHHRQRGWKVVRHHALRRSSLSRIMATVWSSISNEKFMAELDDAAIQGCACSIMVSDRAGAHALPLLDSSSESVWQASNYKVRIAPLYSDKCRSDWLADQWFYQSDEVLREKTSAAIMTPCWFTLRCGSH